MHALRLGMKRWMYSALIATATLVGCTQNGALSPAQRSATQASGASPGSRVLTVGIANEPPSVGAVAPIAGGFGSSFSYRPFNELLEIVDDRGIAHPALAEALPVLNTDTWQVFPDGTMLTTYRLKPNLTWHDGAKLTADDFVFSYHVLMTPGLGFINGKSAPLNHIDDVQAPDERTIVIHWTSPFPGADVLQQGGSILGLPALPRHILEGVYRDGSPDAFGAHPYWNTAFIGTGPYKLDRWEFGSFIDASAFDGYVFGRPKIDHLKILFVEDPNVALSYLRAGTILFATDSAIDFPQALELKKDWGPTHRGVFQYTARSLRSIVFQFRPEYVNPKSLLDVRVRKAIAYAVDKQAINEALFGGEGQTIDSIFDNRADFYPQIDAVITKYPLDLRSSERLMNDAGFRK